MPRTVAARRDLSCKQPARRKIRVLLTLQTGGCGRPATGTRLAAFRSVIQQAAPVDAPLRASYGAYVQLEGRVLGGTYRVERRLEEGGMGMVFEALHLRLHRRVAVKMLSQELAESPEAIARFEQEAELMSQIAHPHVATVLDFDV
jgi:serine/threonine protein kinase